MIISNFNLKVVLVFMVGLVILSPSMNCFAEDENMVRKKGGLKFKLPEDWPIKKQGGVLKPIPVEEYVAKKLKSIETRLDSINKKTLEKLDKVNSNVESNSSNIDKLKKKLNTMEEKINSLQDKFLSRVKEIKEEIEKFRKEVKKFKSSLKVIDKKIKFNSENNSRLFIPAQKKE